MGLKKKKKITQPCYGSELKARPIIKVKEYHFPSRSNQISQPKKKKNEIEMRKLKKLTLSPK